MVTQDQLREHLGRRPFLPFRVTLSSGDVVEVTRVAQAVAMETRMVVATPEDRFRRIPLEQIDRVDVYPA